MSHVLVGRFRPEALATQFQMPVAAVAAYLTNLETHVYSVQTFGRLMRVPEEQLYIHDESKWSAAEFPAYVRKYAMGIDDKPDFERAFLHHLHHNPHHWQHWLLPNVASNTAVDMPENYIREMVADWLGAGAAYNPDQNPQIWLNENFSRMIFSPQSEATLRAVLKEVGLQWPR